MLATNAGNQKRSVDSMRPSHPAHRCWHENMAGAVKIGSVFLEAAFLGSRREFRSLSHPRAHPAGFCIICEPLRASYWFTRQNMISSDGRDRNTSVRLDRIQPEYNTWTYESHWHHDTPSKIVWPSHSCKYMRWRINTLAMMILRFTQEMPTLTFAPPVLDYCPVP